MKNIVYIKLDEFNYELNNDNINKIYELSKYFCLKYKYQIDVIDIKLGDILFNIEQEQEVMNNINDFNYILDYLYNKIFSEKHFNKK